MRQKIIQALKTHLGKRTVAIGVAILLIWGILSSIVIYLNIPFTVYLDITENPWQPISSETYPETGVDTIDFVDSYHGWIAGENGMIMVTTDGGKSWAEQHSGIDTDIIAIDFFNATIGVAISKEDHILITQTGGTIWILLEKVKNPNNRTGISLWDVVTCDGQTAWVIGSTGAFFRVAIPDQNWTCVSQIPLSPHYLAMLNSSHGWATGGYSVIVKTTDGWQTYEEQDAGVSQNFLGIFFWDVHKGWVVGTDNTILATTDGGQHWHVQYTYRPFLAEPGSVAKRDVFFITESKGWAVGGSIHYTKDGGKSWHNLGSETSGPSRIAFANETHGWAVWHLKKRSYITSVGGAPPIDENMLNLGASICIFVGTSIPILFTATLIRYQEHKAPKEGLTRFSDRLCPACGGQILLKAKFCINCGEIIPNDHIPSNKHNQY